MTKIEQDLKDSWKLCPLIIAHLTKEVGLLRVCIGQTTDIDIKSYPLKVIDKLTTMLTTLWKVINIDKDFYVANVVIRSITDNVALLFLIYYKPQIRNLIGCSGTMPEKLQGPFSSTRSLYKRNVRRHKIPLPHKAA